MALLQLCLIAWLLSINMAVGGCVKVTLPGERGILQGAMERSKMKERNYFAFRAIPYAQPPIDRNRFMPTMPGYEWEGVLDATEKGEPCAQAALGIMTGIEDCLNLYVYTPKLPNETEDAPLLPVVVWLHGGSFVVGSASGLDESLLMDRDVVLVIPQYRLGYLGFFKTQGGFSAGNMGLLDQLAALKWVQQNVAAFGGDPKRVILAGEDAGGAAAIYHMLSPLSEGLFHGVMSLSGSPLAPWAYMKFEHRFNLMLANFVKCPAYDPKIMVKCFQEVDVFELLNGTQMLMESRDPVIGNNRISPIAQDAVFVHETTLFLPEHPLKLLSAGQLHKVPVVMGVTRDVGGYLVDMMFYDFIQFTLEDDPDFLGKLLGVLLKECDVRNVSSHEQEFADFYFPGNEFDNLTTLLPGLMNMLGDVHYKTSILSTAQILAEYVPTRVYSFEYEGGPSLFNLRFPDLSSAPPMPNAVGHGDEMVLILPEVDIELTPDQKVMSEKLLDVIENFAYGREPQANWPLFKSEGLDTLVWGSDGSTSTQPFATPERIRMLNNLHNYHHEKILASIKAATENSHDEL